MASSGRYRRVLGHPGVAGVLAPYVVARIASTMVLLALLLQVQHAFGSFLAAGVVTAAFAAAVAVAAPLLGRLADERGSAPVLLVTGVLHPLALLGVVQAASADLAALVLPAAVLAGASVPPLAACMRALWPALLPDDELRPTAFSVESLVVEGCELGGPLLVGGLVAFVDPTAAVLVAAALSCLGTISFALNRNTGRRMRRRQSGPPPLTGPLRVAGMHRMLLVIGLSVASVSALEVAVAGFATGRGTPGLVGWLLGAWIAGSLVAGAYFGARAWSTAPQLQLPLLLCGGSLLGLLPLLAVGPLSMAALLAAAGLCLAPSVAVQFSVLSELAPERRRTESFTWASTAAFLGVAAGNLGSGPLVESAGWRAAVALSAVLGALAAGLAWTARYRFGLPRPLVLQEVQDRLARAVGEREEALAALRALQERHDALRHELAVAQSALPAVPPAVVDPVGRAEQLVASAGSSLEGAIPADLLRLVRLDAALADLRALEQSRARVLGDVERLSEAVAGLPAAVVPAVRPAATVTHLPRQRSGDGQPDVSFG